MKLWEIAWNLWWDHRNQIKHNLEMAQDFECHDSSILLAVWSEHAFGCVGLPHCNWLLFKRPILPLL
jgi:hypothetical protein